MSSYYRSLILTTPAFEGVLNTYPAALGFSVFLLEKDAVSCMDVRRGSDSATMTIGFVGEVMDTATLLTWAGESSVYVTKWYDQQGTMHATQTTPASQPMIVDSGALCVDEHGNPALQFTGIPVFMNITGSLSVMRNIGYAMALVRGRVTNIVSASASAYFAWTVTNAQTRFGLYSRAGVANTNALYERRIDGNTTTMLPDPNVHNANSQHITVIADYAGNVNRYRVDGVQVAAAPGLSAGNTSNTDSLYARIGNNGATIYHIGNISELIVYNSNVFAGSIDVIEANRMEAFL